MAIFARSPVELHPRQPNGQDPANGHFIKKQAQLYQARSSIRCHTKNLSLLGSQLYLPSFAKVKFLILAAEKRSAKLLRLAPAADGRFLSYQQKKNLRGKLGC